MWVRKSSYDHLWSIIRSEQARGDWFRDELNTFKLRNAGWKPDVTHDGKDPVTQWKKGDGPWMSFIKACEMEGIL